MAENNDYRAKALELLSRATGENKQSIRDQYARLAGAYLNLADQAEKHGEERNARLGAVSCLSRPEAAHGSCLSEPIRPATALADDD
jgi:hypothetical protein